MDDAVALTKRQRCAGFSLIEILVTLVLFAVIVLLGLPAMLNALNRAKITGFAQGAASLMQVARLEAVKRTTPVRVEARFTSKDVVAYVDVNGDADFTAGTDFLLGTVTAPNGVALHGPGAVATANLNAVYNLDPIAAGGGVAVFNSDGSVSKLGAFRFRDGRNNILEVYVGPQSSARVAVRKYLCDPSSCNPNAGDDPTLYFEADQGTGWSWY